MTLVGKGCLPPRGNFQFHLQAVMDMTKYVIPTMNSGADGVPGFVLQNSRLFNKNLAFSIVQWNFHIPRFF